MSLASRVLFVLFFAVPSFAQLVVTPANTQGWQFTTSSGTGNVPPPAVYLAPGYETPPLGDGSVHLTPGQDGNDSARARHPGYAGTLLSNITALSYSTFTEVDGSGGQSPYLILQVDTDGVLTTIEHFFFFEPEYQSAAFFPSNPQGPLVDDTWQTWDALAGGWYTNTGLAASGPGANVKSFATLVAALPANAQIVNSSSGAGGVQILTGIGGLAWAEYLGAADNFTIGVSGVNTTYDFEEGPGTIVTVTPSALDGWTPQVVDDDTDTITTGSVTFVTGPGTPPMGDGSVQFNLGTEGEDGVQVRQIGYDGQFIRDLNELTYSTYVQTPGADTQAPYIILDIDLNNDGTRDDLWFFEPAYQTAAFCPSNPQAAVITGAWQTWDAANGCWYSLFGTAGTGPGVNVRPLSVLLDAEPDARLSTNIAGGSLRIVTGFGDVAWDNFVGNADALTASFIGNTTTYDFEPVPSITIADVTQAEGTGGTTNFVFTLTLSEAVSQTVTVDYTTADGTALAADADYTPVIVAGTATFAPQSTSTTITIAVGPDTKFELDETFFVNLTNPQFATIADPQAQGTIQNDDLQPTMSIDDVTLPEGNAGTTNFNFTVSLTNPSFQTITVNYTTNPVMATEGVDYADATGTLTFVPGDVSETITVLVTGETVFETDETFTVDLSGISNATFTDNQGLGTIQNDDTQPTISVNDVALAEGNAGTTNFVFTVTLNNASYQTITVNYTTTPGTATEGTDYTDATGTLTFVPGDVSETITVPVTGDLIFEADETFFVDLSVAVNATILDNQGLGTIQNDDAQPAISIDDVALAEGNAGTTNFVFTVTLSNPSASTVTVNYTTSPVSATEGVDYVLNAGTLTFVPGDVSETITVLVNGDMVFESNEIFRVVLSAPGGATFLDNEGDGTIQNDDGVPTATINDVTLAEGNAGTTPFVFTVTLNNPSDQTITINYTTNPGTATEGVDYADASGTLTFVPGDVSETITVLVTGETMFETDETFFVDLSVPINAAIGDPQGLGTILNDDGQPTISINDVALPEGNAGTTNFVFTVTLSNPSASTITVNYTTNPGTATEGVDYADNIGTVTFVPGDVSETITVAVTGETVFEGNETFFVDLTAPANATILDNQGLGTIQNDDGQPAIIITDVAQAEGTGGTTNFVFTVTLSNPSGTNVTVNYTTNPGTATEGVDYADSTGMLTFVPGDVSETITVVVTADSAFEPNETFFVDLSGATGATLADNQGLGTIQADDGPVADVSITKVGPASTPRDQNVTYTITVTNAGPDTASNVVVTDILPAGTTFVSATPSQGSCSGTTTVTCTLGAIANGGSATISLVITPPTAGVFNNTATVTNTPELDPTPNNNAGTATAFVSSADIPTLSQWALMMLISALLGMAVLKLK